MEHPQDQWSLVDVHADVLMLVAQSLLPYDLLSLCSTCRTLRPLLHEKGLWLVIAERLSYHRPLPFTARQALTLPVEEIYKTCLRIQRVSQKWSWKSEIHPQTKDSIVKISFPDKRRIPYFTYLPGAHHIMAFDLHNHLSCWSTTGNCLASYPVQRGARLTRWKPIDESDSQYEVLQGESTEPSNVIEVMVEQISLPRHTTRYEVIHLTYTDSSAHFKSMQKFKIPNVYEPESALSQDELWGTLVHFRGDPSERFGLFLVDRVAKKAICIDPGFIPDFSPQALISSKYLVLYWETSQGSRSYAYTMATLRSTIAKHGRHCDGEDLHAGLSIPIQVEPDEKYFASFHTVRGPAKVATEGDPIEEEMMEGHTDWYPIVIPKWTTMKDDLKAHWTRSVLTLSKPAPLPHPPVPPVIPGQGNLPNGVFVNGIFQAHQEQGAGGGPGVGGGQGVGGVPDVGGPLQMPIPVLALGQGPLNMQQIMQVAGQQAQVIMNAHIANNGPAAAIAPNAGAGAAAAGAGLPPVAHAAPPPPVAEPVHQNGGENNEDVPNPEAALAFAPVDDGDNDVDMDEVQADLVAGEDGVVPGEDGELFNMPPLIPAAGEFPAPDPHAPPEPMPPPPMPQPQFFPPNFHVHHRPPTRRTTITHHYYSFTDREPLIKRTLIAEARVRQPRTIDQHVGAMFGFDFVGGQQAFPMGVMGNILQPGAAPAPPAAPDAQAPVGFGAGAGGAPGGGAQPPWPPPLFGPGGPQGPWIFGGNANGGGVVGLGGAQPPQMPGMGLGNVMLMGFNMAPLLGEGPGPVPLIPQIPAPGGIPPAGEGLGGGNFAGDAPIPDDVNDPHDFPEFNMPHFVDDMGSCAPVMGYGGRCALWVQEDDVPGGGVRQGTVKLATFPSPLKSANTEQAGSVSICPYSDLERAGGSICSVHVPEGADVENAIAFDLDDVRGVLGISNTKGEIWLVDYS